MTGKPPNGKAAWEEVGRQFEPPGRSIAVASGAAWQDPNNRAELEKIKASIMQITDDVEKTVSQAARQPIKPLQPCRAKHFLKPVDGSGRFSQV
ncbi:MAG: hypothetical protein WBV22_04570 [Anaerolineaceae bacterium]